MSTSLSEFIPEGAIALDVELDTWQEAVRAAGAMLEAAEVATAEYTEAMVVNVNDHGPYIVIAPGFAFAHARPTEAVLRTGISWLRLKNPVNFGHEDHDPVALVVALAAKDSSQHTQAMAQLAEVIGDEGTRVALNEAASAAELRRVLGDEHPLSGEEATSSSAGETAGEKSAQQSSAEGRREDVHLVLTVCGNGLGTSLFLKNTVEDVLMTWGWSRHVRVEATDTISARGRASEAAAILTSGEIAKTLGDVGVPVRVVENFTSTMELDTALRELYDV